MSKFITDELFTIDCGGNEWVKIPFAISTEEAEKIGNLTKQEKAFEIALFFIREWNFIDRDGKIAPLCLDNIKRLDNVVFSHIIIKCMERLNLSKKKFLSSIEPSEDMKETKSIQTT